MKTHIISISGRRTREITLPRCFSTKIREDIVAKVLEAKKIKQPYGSNPVAGKQYSASGKLVHRRHVWKSQYGRGMSRIPRKAFTRRGSQFRWEGATAPNTKGGRRAHPPKAISMINVKKINKRELKKAFESALSATADKIFIEKKYQRIHNLEKAIPIVVESKITELKVKELLKSLKEILGEKLFEIGIKKKSVRAGKGKLRGRKYKSNAGLLFVIGNKEEIKTNAFDVVRVKNLGITDLAKGGVGRLAVYTENAIKDLENKKDGGKNE